ncbi:hypothetical protein Tco_1190651, partial [Tanacetum coccineum]
AQLLQARPRQLLLLHTQSGQRQPSDVFMYEESDFAAPDMVSDDEDIGNQYIPKINLKQDWFNPLYEDERPATPEPAWSIPSSSLSVPTHNWASAIASSYVPPPENSLLSQTGDIRVFIDWFCKKQGITELTPEHLEGPAYEVVKAFHPDGDKLALSITKMKVAYYPDVRLEQMVPDQIWIEEECMYDIFATYGISHWWFKRHKFYIDRHSAKTNRRAIVRTHMRILNVVSIDVFFIYGLPEPPTAKGQEDSLFCYQPMDHESGYQTTGRRLPTQHREDKYGMQMIMRFNEIYKFSDGTLQQINEALDYWVKEFIVNKVNPGLNTRFWTTNDVIKSKQFMFSIQKRLKLRRIFRNLESFVGGRLREGDYRLLWRTE